MPELPDIAVYVDALRRRIVGQRMVRVRLASPFLVRSVDPPLDSAEGQTVVDVRRLAKRIVLQMDNDVFLVFHLMIAGRFRWAKPAARAPGKTGLAAFEFPTGTLILTESGTKKRAALHLVRGTDALAAHDPGGIEVLEANEAAFAAALRGENHTLKRALTDPRLVAGIGNAYSDEILHAARLSPFTLTSRLDDDGIRRLHKAVRDTLTRWTDRLRADFQDRFPGPGDITAFRPDFAVHGRYGQPCPDCGVPVQRVRYAENEMNYCPSCQTGGRVLADRSLSRLLRDDWPRTVDELERP